MSIAGQRISPLFTTLEQFLLSGLTLFVVIVLVALFFVSDAASLVMGMPSLYGTLTCCAPSW